MTGKQIRVYTASKLIHAEALRARRLTDDGIYYTARWPVTANLASESAKPASHWQQDNFDDIARSDFVIVYVEAEEHLKGALVEVGYGLAHGKHTFLIGAHPDYSKWQYHPLVHRVGSLDQAIVEIKVLARGFHPAVVS